MGCESGIAFALQSADPRVLGTSQLLGATENSMGIYGALSTAVSGLRAQAFALENISGNIANSQTTGFKRIDTDFVDLIPDAPRRQQTAGSVLAQSRSTNSIQGDIRSSGTDTNMAINGNGFFIVEPRIGQADGDSVFGGSNYYTRRGDFELDKNGYLVNGSGYYLKGLPIDPQTQNISGSVPQVLQLSNQFLPASQTTRVNYQLNLPQTPKTANYQQSPIAGNELLNAADFVAITPDTEATTTGTSVLTSGTAIGDVLTVGDALAITVGGTTRSFTVTNGTGNSATEIDVAATADVAALLTHLNAEFANATFALNGDGNLTVTADNLAEDVVITTDGTQGTTGNGLGLMTGTYEDTVSEGLRLATPVPTISAANSDEFISQSISGGAITVYAASGAPANVQVRWAKVNSTDNGGADRWNMFILTDSNATGTEPAWSRVGGNYTFGADGTPNPAVEFTDLTNLTVNDVEVGNVRLQHGTNGLSQFADPNGTAEVTQLSQNGYAAGEFVSVGVSESGRVVVTYNNGQQLEVAQVVTANFNAANALKRMDGGVFAATSESGEPILESEGGIVGSSVETSNTDISEEFTKLIVTQQAYAASTRIVSTADEMLQEALNMVR
jgi:flagellar hook protein FlgE